MFEKLTTIMASVKEAHSGSLKTIRKAVFRGAMYGLVILVGWTFLKGLLTMLPGIFIAVVGFLVVWKFLR